MVRATMTATTTMPVTNKTTMRISSASMLSAINTDVAESAMGLGASLRDRATLPSPLRGLVPPGGYPSRLHSLRSFSADAWPAPRRARRRVPGPHDMRTIRAPCSASAASSSRRRCAPRSSSASPRSPRPAAPAFAPRDALAPAPVQTLVRALPPVPRSPRRARPSRFVSPHPAAQSAAAAPPCRVLRRRFPCRFSFGFSPLTPRRARLRHT